jgi:hypothetical protein
MPMLALDLGSIASYSGGLALTRLAHEPIGGALAYAGVATYLLGGPIVHFANGQVGKGFGSLGLRFFSVIPTVALGGAIGGALDTDPHRTGDHQDWGLLLGLLGGMVIGSALDNGLLAYKSETTTNDASWTVAPALDLKRSSLSVHWSGRF